MSRNDLMAVIAIVVGIVFLIFSGITSCAAHEKRKIERDKQNFTTCVNAGGTPVDNYGIDCYWPRPNTMSDRLRRR